MARSLSAKDTLQLMLASDSGEDLDNDKYGNSADFSCESDDDSLTDMSASHSPVRHDRVAPTGPGAGPNAHSENISTDSDSDVPTTRDSSGARLCVNAAPNCQKAHSFLPRVP